MHNRIDFRWLAAGRSIDHTTISEFRRRCSDQFRGLFIRVVQVARDGPGPLRPVGFRRHAGPGQQSPHRHPHPRTEREELAAQFREHQRLADEADARDAALGGDASTRRLPAGCRDQAKRLQRLDATLEALRRVEEEEGGKAPKRVPTTDLDARVMPNKQGGGFAPNYTPTTTVDIDSGPIVGVEVLNAINEDARLAPSVEQVCRDFALATPPVVLADGLIGTAANLAACAEGGIDLYSPCPAPRDPATNPAVRDDPTQPVAEADRDRLPMETIGGKSNPVTRLSKAAFVYNESRDCFFCPMSQALPCGRPREKRAVRGGECGRVTRRRGRTARAAHCAPAACRRAGAGSSAGSRTCRTWSGTPARWRRRRRRRLIRRAATRASGRSP